MKKGLVGALVAVVIVGTAVFAVAGPDGSGAFIQRVQAYGGGWGYGPGMGRGYGMGPGGMGMMGGGGPGGGYGSGGMMGWGAGQGGPGFSQAEQPVTPVTKDSATQILQGYVARMGNPNLHLGAITKSGANFEAKVVTKDGSLVERLIVEKATGRVYPVF